MKKNYSRKFETSPLFNFANSELTTLETQLIDLELDNTTIQKYLPLNNINIQNNSGQDVEIIINQDEQKKYLMRNGTIVSLDETVLPAIKYISIYNRSGSTISANTINITVFRQGVTSDSVVQNVHRKLFQRKSLNVF